MASCAFCMLLKYCLDASGEYWESTWDDGKKDKNRLSIGNVFLTKEDANFARQRLKVIAELKKYAKEFSDEEWMNQSIGKHYVTFDCEDHAIKIG